MLELILFIQHYLQFTLIFFLVLFMAFAVLMEIKTEVEGTRLDLFFKVFLQVPFVIADWLMNIVLSPVFLDLPAKPFELVTGRMKRYKFKHGDLPPLLLTRIERWRYGFARWLCNHLNRHDAGHC